MKCLMFDNYNPEMCKFCSAWCPNRPYDVTITTNNVGTISSNIIVRIAYPNGQQK